MILINLFLGFFILTLIFIPLEKIFFVRKQKIFRVAIFTDITYFFLGKFIGILGGKISIFCASLLLSIFNNFDLNLKINQLPIWLQIITALLISDMGYYIAHRMSHEIPFLWRFHAIHHSVKEMDWLATVRIHPFDQIFTKLFQMIPLYFLGFNPEILAIYLLFCAGIGFFIHSNLNLKLGIFKYIIANPQFHHWHHSIESQAYNKNYAAQFPMIDLLFGTLYLPKNKIATEYGITEYIPNNYFKQLIHPFISHHKK
ncbi:MAG TPA: sterol desaturase family protein [Allocoleopsis sp.]